MRVLLLTYGSRGDVEVPVGPPVRPMTTGVMPAGVWL